MKRYSFLLLLFLVACKNEPQKLPPLPSVEIHKVQSAPVVLPSLTIATAKGKKVIHPSVWNQRTLSFSDGIPQPYKVKKGDNLYVISKETSVPIADIVAKNRLSPPYIIHPGQVLTLLSPKIHFVSEEEDLYKVALLHKVSLSALAHANYLKAPYRLRKGQSLLLPASVREPIRLPTSNVVVPFHKKTQQDLSKENGSSLFLRPVKGRVIASYGTQGHGLHNDGINIEAPLGTPVHAAADGKVAYVGSGIRSYGNLTLIKHDGGWMTAYAHLDTIKVKEGQVIQKGQTIATVGKSGIKEPQLHFEIRRDATPLNPVDYLK